MRYPRIYADEQGDTHFAEVENDLSPIAFVPGTPPLRMSVPHPATAAVLTAVPSSWEGGRHPTPRRQLAVGISGQAEFRTTDGDVRAFGPGSVVLLEDTAGKGHDFRVVGDEVVVLLIWLDAG